MNIKIRKTKTGKILFNRNLENNESQTKKNLYKKVINKCCMPGCNFGFDLHVHHIHPIKKGGFDNFENYIILCSHCHRNSKIHSRSEENKIALLVYKFMIEQEVFGLGVSSDNYSDQEFMKLIKNKIYKRNYEIRSLKEEKKDDVL